MRMPSYSRSFEEWADYLLEEEMTVDDAIAKTSSDFVADWLGDQRSFIEAAIHEKGTATATFVTQGDIVDSEELEDNADDDAVPAKGIRV